MKDWILGINHTNDHDSSVCLLHDDRIVFATAEERLSRVKHDSRFPRLAIRAALDQAGIAPEDIAAVGLSWPKPQVALRHDLASLLFGRVPRARSWTLGPLITYAQSTIGGGARTRLTSALESQSVPPTHLFGHHLTHAWSAALMSPESRMGVLVMDGRGARNATSIWLKENGGLRQLDEKLFPDSLGLFYARITKYLGFQPNADEWKVMGLAPFGNPGIIMDPFLLVDEDSYRVNARGLLGRDSTDLSGLEAAFGPARKPDDRIEDRHRDIAFAAQARVEEAIVAMARRAVRLTGSRHLALAGGVALNCKANGLILESGLVDELVIQPAASDDGAALGAAAAAQAVAIGTCRIPPIVRADFGQEVAESEIAQALRTYKLRFERAADPANAAAERLADGRIVGWFQGRAEFGPRALGHRSILADPRDATVRDRVNAAVKFRESWRPFAPSILEEYASDFFEGCNSAPYMIVTFRALPSSVRGAPAVVHVDGTARVQTVNRSIDPLFWSLIRKFADLTGVPIVLNTSFNLKGDPIVNTVRDAVQTFYSSGLDCLVIGPFCVDKSPYPRPGSERKLLAKAHPEFATVESIQDGLHER